MSLVAVYGTLRRKQGNNHLLRNSTFVSIEQTKPEWEMFSLGGFPGIRKGNKTITIELYQVDENTELSLDNLEGYRKNSPHNFYNKEKIETSQGEATIYTLQGEEYKTHPVLETGDWLNR